MLTVQGDRLISGSWDKTIRVWDMEAFECCSILGGHNESVLALAPYSSKLLVSGSYDSNLHVWDLETSTRVGVLEGHDDAIRILTSTADCVYSGSYDGTIGAWNIGVVERQHSRDALGTPGGLGGRAGSGGLGWSRESI